MTSILAPEGTTVQASAKLAVIAGAQSAAPSSEDAPAAAKKTAPGKQRHRRRPIREKGDGRGTPEPRSGHRTGRDGRIMKDDIAKAIASTQTTAEAAQAPRAPVSADDASREERVKMTRLRQTIARRLMTVKIQPQC